MLTDSQRGVSWLRREVQRELKYAEVEGPGSLWGSTPMAQNPVPRWVHLSAFVIHTFGACNYGGPMTRSIVH